VGTGTYFLTTALPTLGEPGSRPPLTLLELAGWLGDSTAAPLVTLVLLWDDLIQREAFLAGTLADPGPVLLTQGQVQGQEPLPDFLARDPEVRHRAVASDGVQAAYFAHVAAEAERRRSIFLAAWVAEEVGLRNAVAAARARALGFSPSHFQVLSGLGRPSGAYDALIAAWEAAPNPLAGHHVLLRARWAWLLEHDAWFSFSTDELVAYAVRLSMLHRWYRMLGDMP
jgi:hypothetical protein